MHSPRLWTVACALALALGVGACGKVAQPSSAENDGVYVNSGAITYQLQVSRELNPFITEDSQYLTGLPSGTAALKPNELWYGVFLWAKNQSKQPQATSDNVDIVDTQGDKFYPVQLDSAVNQYAYRSQTLLPSGIAPGPSTTASFGPTQGALLLFRLNTSVYSNRPLTLQIYAPGQQAPAEISLDL